MFVACYLPVLPPNMIEDPSRKGFKTESDCWEYVFSQMCDLCKQVRQNALLGKTVNLKENWVNGLEPPTLFPACSCEWNVASEDEIDSDQLEKMKEI